MPFSFGEETQPATIRTAPDFIAHTKITTPHGADAVLTPFTLWPEQYRVLSHLEQDRLLLLLKARQIGMTWLTCAYVLWRCMQYGNRTVLMFSQGLREANELIDRVRLLFSSYEDDDDPLPALIVDNASELEWENRSRIKSLPATRRAGRSFTASIVVLDEFAFMQWGSELMAAVKPTIDGGGQLIVLSSADGNGTLFHRFWQAAKNGANGYTPLFLSWQANPDRGATWRQNRMAEGLSESDVLREYPSNDIEAFVHATGLVYDTWADPGNVTEEAEYIKDGGSIYWAVDDGYAGERDAKTGYFTADSHPRVFLFVQERADGRLCVFHEDYRVRALSDGHITDMLALPYPQPDYCAVDSSAAELRGRLQSAGLYVRGKPASVEESIKALHRMLAPDANGWRRVLVHPRCKHLRAEMASYRRDSVTEKPVAAYDHGPSALRYFTWTKRLDQ